MKRLPDLVICLLFFVAGCGVNHVNENEATSGWRVASPPLLEGQQAIQQKAQQNPGRLAAGETIRHTVDCESSGSVRFSLTADFENPPGGGTGAPDTGGMSDAGSISDAGRSDAGLPPDAGMSAGPTVDLVADYRECDTDGTTVGGQLDIDSPQFAQIGAGGMPGGDSESCDCPEPVPVTYTGKLDYSGKVDGPCQVDMTAEFPPWGQPTYTGKMCGFDASDVLGTAF